MKKSDFVLMAFLLVFGFCMAFALSGTDVGSNVEIYSNGALFGKYSLHENRTVTVKSSFGTNIVQIKNGSAFVLQSTCKDKLEIEAGVISKSGQSLVCLPNRLVISIAGKESVDSVSY